MIPGAKGIQSLVHHIPSWLSFSPTEKMEWLNKLLSEAEDGLTVVLDNLTAPMAETEE